MLLQPRHSSSSSAIALVSMATRSVESQFGQPVVPGVEHLADHLMKRCTIDAAQCASRAGKFLIEDGGLFERHADD